MDDIEITKIDRRFEGSRIRDTFKEKMILTSVMEEGIREPLRCVRNARSEVILLDGFKRLRSSLRLKIGTVPIGYIGDDEISGITQLLRTSNMQNMNILEEAALIDKLHIGYGKSASGIADEIGRSNAWVSVRLGLIGEMSENTRQIVFAGKFPVRSYMYTIRHFTRVKKVPLYKIDEFINLIAGKRLSTREIDTLAQGYFQGNDDLIRQIQHGNIGWTLKQLKGCTDKYRDMGLQRIERQMIEDLENSQKYLKSVGYGILEFRYKTDLFFKASCLLIKDILEELPAYKRKLEIFYAQWGPKESHKDPS